MLTIQDNREMKINPRNLKELAQEFWDADTGHRMTAADLMIFALVASHPDGMQMQDILDACPGLKPATLTGAANKFKKLGWAEKDGDSEDERKKLIRMSSKGRKFLHGLIN